MIFDHIRDIVYLDIESERLRQESIGRKRREEGIAWHSCADPEMEGGDGTRLTVLVEEVGEVARALLEKTNLREELIQVAAVACAWLEAIDGRAA